MIKKLLSLLIIFVLLLSTISCTESEGGRGLGDGLGSAFYTATYEEVKSTIDVIYERKVVMSDKKFILLDAFANECEIVYNFSRFGSITNRAQSLEEFYTAPKTMISISWHAELFLGECPHAGEATDHRYMLHFFAFESKEHRSSVVLSWGEDTISEATDPSLWTVDKDYSEAESDNTWCYKFLYDGKCIYRAYSCFELDDGMLEKFREAIIDAYLPAAE